MHDKPIYTLGIDPSLNCTGWAILEDKNLKACGSIKMLTSKGHKPKRFADKERNDKLKRIAFEIINVISSNVPHLHVVGIEEERVFKSTSAALIGEVIGLLKGAIIVSSDGGRFGDFGFIDVNVQSARSVFGIGGMERHEKKYILERVRKAYPYITIPDHNAADAVVTAYFTYNLYSRLV